MRTCSSLSVQLSGQAFTGIDQEPEPEAVTIGVDFHPAD